MKKRLICILLTAVLLLGLYPAVNAAYTEMHFSDQLVAYIKQGEGFSPQPVSDGTGWYIGYGCQINKSDYPNGITEPEAEALLRSYMQRFADHINQNFLKQYGLSVNQSQFDAMCAMSYALGPSWLKQGNRLPDYLIAGIDNYTERQIAGALAAWCHVGGAVNQVALQRRIMEAKMFLYGDYSFSAEGWNWLILDANGGKNQYSDVAVFPTGETYETLPVVTKDGWYFAGWATADGRVLTPGDIVSENLNVTAQWSATPVAQPEPTDPDNPFPDVPNDAWYAADVVTLFDSGVISGFEDGSFRPRASVTWGQALKLFLLAAGYPAQTPDKPKEGEAAPHWASEYLHYAEEKGFVAEGAVKDLDAPILRDEMADLCAAALELTETVSPSPYADTERESVLKLYAAELMIGSVTNDGRRLFKGGDNISRAEICAVLVRVADYVERTLILFAGYRIPVDYSLRMNTRDNEGFYEKNGRTYYDDGVSQVRYGIDVSEHQYNIDWKAVAADGIDFAMIRCGYRSYGSKASLNEDPYFRKNIQGALDAGLDVGVYFFSQALSVAEAKEEAAFALELIRGYDIRFPVVFDWEIIPNAGSRTANYQKKDVADFMEVFCEAVAAEGYTPMVYFNPALAYLRLDLSKAQNYNGWLAHYVDRTDYRYDYQMWQYGSSGTVKGISGRCDMDIAFVDFAAQE